MFSLIISIIAIALVAALALASIYYGGEAFNKGTTDADASTIINQGQQIQAAVTMSNIDRVSYADSALSHLETEYLQEVPTFQGETWSAPTAGYSTLSATVALNADVCTALNEKAGVTTPLAAGSEAGVFGCNADGVAFYRVGSFYGA